LSRKSQPKPKLATVDYWLKRSTTNYIVLKNQCAQIFFFYVFFSGNPLLNSWKKLCPSSGREFYLTIYFFSSQSINFRVSWLFKKCSYEKRNYLSLQDLYQGIVDLYRKFHGPRIRITNPHESSQILTTVCSMNPKKYSTNPSPWIRIESGLTNPTYFQTTCVMNSIRRPVFKRSVLRIPFVRPTISKCPIHRDSSSNPATLQLSFPSNCVLL
jgi:hypothetical protein